MISTTHFEDTSSINEPVKPKNLQMNKTDAIPGNDWVKNMNMWSVPTDYPLLQIEREKGALKSELYRFHTYEDFLRYNDNAKPVNKKVKIIGKFKIAPNSVPYIQECQYKHQDSVIFVNWKLVRSMPNKDEVVEIFGHLEFDKVAEVNIPIIVAHFYRRIDENVSKYISITRVLNRFLPSGAFELEKGEEDFEDSYRAYSMVRNAIINILSFT